MTLIKRKRLLFWLIKAYFKKWRSTIALSFVLGLAAFFILRFVSVYFVKKIPFINKQTVGVVGVYTPETLPEEIQRKLSRGLTYISDDGTPKPDVAESWEIKDSGKTYVFKLKKNIFFSDKKQAHSSNISYNFQDVKTEKPDKYTIIFKLKSPYSPFLVTVSRPFLRGNFIGVGDYKLKKINVNGSFVESIDLSRVKDEYSILSYQMYPTEQALKTAFVLGEITKASGLYDTSFRNTSFEKFKNVKIEKITDKKELVTIFYNNQDSVLSDKKIRQALSNAIQDNFVQGSRNYEPFPGTLWASQEIVNFDQQDIEHARSLLEKADSATSGAKLKFTIKTLPKYEKTAVIIQKNWKAIGVESDIKVADSLPSSFQIFLGDFKLPQDPDQYTLWHSEQSNNITRYKNLRIDKLLEDGRQITDYSKRQKIYADFEKYLLDDAPATFLYLPYKYNISH